MFNELDYLLQFQPACCLNCFLDSFTEKKILKTILINVSLQAIRYIMEPS